MPRLLLVDDNPSIHRIAESLLAPTDVELVCVASAAEALDRIERGERFDVALIDTAMPGMDGWTLLDRFRDMEATNRMPIALMAGVLDPVDPSKLARAPIQGFLKKPIELRELGDRVKALLATPVVVSPSPFSTLPSTSVKDLMKRAEEPLPELRPEPPEPAAPADLEVGRPEPEDDLLVLTAEDLWPEEPPTAGIEPAPPSAVLHDVHLELEELDLDSLQDLAAEPLDASEPAAGLLPESPAFEPEEVLTVEADNILTLSGLEELEALPMDFIEPAPSPAPEPLPDSDDALAHLPAAATLLGTEGGQESAELVDFALTDEVQDLEPVLLESAAILQEPGPDLQEFAAMASEPPFQVEAGEPVLSAAADGQAAAVSGQDARVSAEPSTVTAEQARAVVQAMLADPVLVDALVRAVVARMGDQVLREIAWEVMPELAGRLQS